jgi:threonine dehydratase
MTRAMIRPVSRAAITRAARLIEPYIRRTPVLDLPGGGFGHAGPLSLKLELLQHAGSFKSRGAFTNLLTRPVGPAGVTAASGGNHGAAVAYAASRLGHPATIFVPEISPPAKVRRIRDFGAEAVVGGRRYDDAQAACDAHAAASGALKVHPFEAAETQAGQGTVSREWEKQAGPLDTVLVAAGGGGLVAGMASWWRGKVKVVAVEPEGSCALHAALAAGGPVPVPVESLAADSLGARQVGNLVHAAAAAFVDHVALVPDEAIRAAMRALWQDFRLAVEPGGAAALAALLCGAYRPSPGERLGVLICGANVDPGRFPEVFG